MNAQLAEGLAVKRIPKNQQQLKRYGSGSRSQQRTPSAVWWQPNLEVDARSRVLPS